MATKSSKIAYLLQRLQALQQRSLVRLPLWLAHESAL